jgi:phage gp16-like protein
MRKRLLGRIHVMSKELALADDSYRDVLERIGGQRSAALLDDRQLYAVVQEFERLGAGRKQPRSAKRRPLADTPMARRCRAQWLTLWNLDELDDGSEAALAAFVKRQTGKEDMRFCNAADLSRVIEALKDMCRRAGLREIEGGLGTLVPKRELVRAQWGRLADSGWAKVKGDWGLQAFAHATWCTPNARSVDQMEAEHLDRLAMKLGRPVREQQLGRRRQDGAA